MVSTQARAGKLEKHLNTMAKTDEPAGAGMRQEVSTVQHLFPSPDSTSTLEHSIHPPDLNLTTAQQRIAALDARVGEDLQKDGCRALSRADYLELRECLKEYGYEVAHTDKVKPTAQYPLESRCLYARPAKGLVQLFIERDLYAWDQGMNYLQVGNVSMSRGFRKKYEKAARKTHWGSTLGLGLGGGYLVGMIGNGGSFFPGTLVEALMVSGSLGISIGVRLINWATKGEELKYGFEITRHPRDAILKAFNLYGTQQP